MDSANNSAGLTSYETPAKGSTLEKKRPMTARKWTERKNDGTPVMKEDDTATAMQYIGALKKIWKDGRNKEIIDRIKNDYIPRYAHRLKACESRCGECANCKAHCKRVHNVNVQQCNDEIKSTKERVIDAEIDPFDKTRVGRTV